MSDLDTFIREAFEENFERLRQEAGKSITSNVKDAALQQVLLYWQKLKLLAEKVTETEVRLTLPEQRSPSGRRFTLEGVVDIVREDDKTTMYDVKTHLDALAAGEDLEPYRKQPNVYAHIWSNLRDQELDAVAIITTQPTRQLRMALDSGDPFRVLRAFEEWQPVIDIPLTQEMVQRVVREFGEVVDAIEERRFDSPSVDVLKGPVRSGSNLPFATAVCRNCDARFSCDSFRQYTVRSQRNLRPDAVMRSYLEDYGNDFERNEWTDANIPTLANSRFDDLEEA